MNPRPLRMLTLLTTLALGLAARVAHADDAPVPSPERAPGMAASAPAPPPRCAVERHDGISDVDAAGVEDVVCGLVHASGRPGQHRIRVMKLGSKVVLTLAADVGGAIDERQVVLSNLDEVGIAAPRLLEAHAEQKSVAETIDVTNVVGDEARTPKKRVSSVHGWLGIIGAGIAGGAGGGINLGLSAGSDRWSFVGDLRLAGEAFNKPAALAGQVFTLGTVKLNSEASFAFVSLSGGARHHFSLSDIAPFVGTGLGLDYVSHGTPARMSSCCTPDATGKTGLAAYAEIGLDVLRTHTVGGAIVFRGDLPAFSIDETMVDPADPSRRLRRTTYSPVLGAGIALRF